MNGDDGAGSVIIDVAICGFSAAFANVINTVSKIHPSQGRSHDHISLGRNVPPSSSYNVQSYFAIYKFTVTIAN